MTIRNLLAFGAFLILADSSMAQTMPSPQPLYEADTAFSAMAQTDGLAKAFVHFADQDVILLQQGDMPIYGKAKLAEKYSRIEGSPLSWEPLKAEIAQSGDLGYTFGRYTLKGPTKVTVGVYVSVWKKQADGSWKYVVDGGGPTTALAEKP
jgi:ketosteroid isomerase-like protein